MRNLIDDFLSGLANSSGKSIGDGCENIATGTKAILHPFSNSRAKHGSDDINLNDEIMNYFKENIRSIEIETMSETTEYNDILKWAAQNKCGDKLYLLKYNETKNKVVFIFVFFGNGNTLLLDESHPQRCYIAKTLPQAINDLFQGKTIFVQPFKK